MAIEESQFLRAPDLPSAADTLFDAAQETWWHNACLNFSHDAWHLYVVGYKDAADALVAGALANRGEQDTLVYPILFLYRQYLELAIKNLIRLGRRLQDIECAAPAHHRLNDLWSTCRQLLQDISPGDAENEQQQITRLIEEFCGVDPMSTAFRYPVDKQGNRSLPGLSHIDLRNVERVVEKISVILDGADAMIGEYLSIKADTEADMYADCRP